MNIILIGMPGAGKSTLGVLSAKAMGMFFIDSDILIQQKTGRLLQDIIDSDGIEAFLSAEEAVLCSISTDNSIIATGGSAVYSEKGMQNLKQNGKVIYIRADFDEIKTRVTDITTRGIVLKHGKTLEDAFCERQPLYEKYADITIDCTGQTVEKSVKAIIESIKQTYCTTLKK